MSGFSFKDFLKKLKVNTKLRIAVILGILGIILIIGSNAFSEPPKSDNGDVKNNTIKNNTRDDENASAYKNKEYLEKDLEEILSRIENAGRVKVMITYENGGELVTEKDTRKRETSQTEEDGEGGKRNVQESESESQVIYTGDGNSKMPFVKSETYPKIRGVVVVAEGAGDDVVAGKITRALEVLLDLPVHKIHVTK